MSDKRYTEDEIRAAVLKMLRGHWGDTTLPNLADDVIAELTRPEIGPDVVVTYDWQGRPQGVTTYRHLRNVDATNIMPHYPEDKVLEMLDEMLDGFVLSKHDCEVATRIMQRKMDAFKRGEG